MQTVSVHVKEAYDVLIEDGILDKAGDEIRKTLGLARIMIVADDTVDRLYGARLESALTAAGFTFSKFVIPHGEASKSAQNWLALLNKLAEESFTRTDILCALGGGVVGDLTGFAAASYLRGVRYVGIPTTLLAMTDSSVGGKTAIDLPAGKNLCGAFHQPSLVLSDPETLGTLPSEIFADGMAEVIKYGVIGDPALFNMLRSPNSLPMEEIIRRAVAMKANIVEEDEHDRSVRKLLNFGHTAGHAIEAVSGFTVLHGHAVAAGMVIAARFAAARGSCDTSVISEIADTVRLYGLPDAFSYPPEKLTETALRDKKREADTIDLILPLEIGKAEICRLPVSEISAFLSGGAV